MFSVQTLRISKRLGAMQPHFDDDDVATQSSIEPNKLPTATEVPKSNRQKRVQFDETANKVYANTVLHADDDNDDEYRARWYNGHDLFEFRRDYADLLLTLRHLDKEAVKNPNAWAGTLRRAYHAFCAYNNPNEMVEALRGIPNTFLLSTLGTERAAIRSIVTDTVARRKQIYNHVLQWQKAPIRDEKLRANMIRDASRSISRPSRLFARHIAEMAAGKAIFKTTTGRMI